MNNDDYTSALGELIEFFETLSESERRENLIDLADTSATYAPKEGDMFDYEDVRHDIECTDKVGVYVRLRNDDRVYFAVSLGPNVQTLTKALAAILCRGLNGSTIEEVLLVPRDFIPRIIGTELVRLRSRTAYYLLDRIKQAASSLIQIRNGPR